MTEAQTKLRYEQTYLVLTGVFIAALVSCNLIFKKFFIWTIPLPWGGTYDFEQSVGLLPYPLTFLVTDILSEVYGRRRANQVVTAGLFASLFVLALLWVADLVSATGWSSPAEGFVDDGTFHLVFGQAWVAFGASMSAYLLAQYMDIRFFHFWRRLTNGDHLWLRNNASTVASQILDTGLVLFLLAALGDQESGVTFERFPRLFVNGVAFKTLVAALDTPLFYLAVFQARRWFPEQVREAHEE